MGDFTLFWIISNFLTFHFCTFSVIYTFYFYVAFEELTFYQKCSIKCVLYSLFYLLKVWTPTYKNANALVTNGISVHPAPLWKQTKPPPTVVTLNASLRFKRGPQAIKRQQSPFIKDALVWMSWCFWAKSTNEIEDTDAVDEENDDGGHSVIC